MWPISLIEGPREPKHTYSLLESVFSELESIFRDGLEVFDSLTKKKSGFEQVWLQPSMTCQPHPSSVSFSFFLFSVAAEHSVQLGTPVIARMSSVHCAITQAVSVGASLLRMKTPR